MQKKTDQYTLQIQENYNDLVKLKANSLYDDIRYEQDKFITPNNLNIIGTLTWYITEFRKTNNPYYIDFMIILAKNNGFSITKSIEKALIEACKCRITESTKGGLKEIVRNNIKKHALITMFNMIHFLDMSKKEASERVAFYIYNITGEPKIRATSLYKELNSFIHNNSSINTIKNYSEDNKLKTVENWKNYIHLYPLPPDGHVVLGI